MRVFDDHQQRIQDKPGNYQEHPRDQDKCTADGNTIMERTAPRIIHRENPELSNQPTYYKSTSGYSEQEQRSTVTDQINQLGEDANTMRDRVFLVLVGDIILYRYG